LRLTDNAVTWIQLALSLSGVALLGWGWVLARAGPPGSVAWGGPPGSVAWGGPPGSVAWGGRPAAWRGLRDALLVVLGILGAAAYFNFGALHHPNFIHVWDTYHYYVGAKYFPELGYTRLYDCTVVADAEAIGRNNVQRRLITDLRTNAIVPASTVLADPKACKDHFTPQRWDAFTRDVGFFRLRASLDKWELVLKDHGYNATPVWNALGQALANTGPATKTQIVYLLLLDPLFLLAAAAMIAWAFGWRVAMVALLFLGTDIPGRFLWTGGAFLRHDWLFWLVGSICLLKKDKPFLAGAFIAYATLLRLFPGLAIAGPVCALAEIWRRERRLDARLTRYFAGGIAASVVLVAASSAISGGVETWEEFARNAGKHSATPLTNHMGLPTVLAFRPGTTASHLNDIASADPWGAWKSARIANLREARPAFVLACALFLAMLYFAVAHAGAEPWIAASLGVGMIAVGAELTCYYYCFFAGVLLAMHRRATAGILVMALSAGWLVIDRVSTSPWDDEKYVAMSVLALAVYAVILLSFAGVLRSWTPALEDAPPRPAF
jgi:hypothetical protein